MSEEQAKLVRPRLVELQKAVDGAVTKYSLFATAESTATKEAFKSAAKKFVEAFEGTFDNVFTKKVSRGTVKKFVSILDAVSDNAAAILLKSSIAATEILRGCAPNSEEGPTAQIVLATFIAQTNNSFQTFDTFKRAHFMVMKEMTATKTTQSLIKAKAKCSVEHNRVKRTATANAFDKAHAQSEAANKKAQDTAVSDYMASQDNLELRIYKLFVDINESFVTGVTIAQPSTASDQHLSEEWAELVTTTTEIFNAYRTEIEKSSADAARDRAGPEKAATDARESAADARKVSANAREASINSAKQKLTITEEAAEVTALADIIKQAEAADDAKKIADDAKKVADAAANDAHTAYDVAANANNAFLTLRMTDLSTAIFFRSKTVDGIFKSRTAIRNIADAKAIATKKTADAAAAKAHSTDGDSRAADLTSKAADADYEAAIMQQADSPAAENTTCKATANFAEATTHVDDSAKEINDADIVNQKATEASVKPAQATTGDYQSTKGTDQEASAFSCEARSAATENSAFALPEAAINNYDKLPNLQKALLMVDIYNSKLSSHARDYAAVTRKAAIQAHAERVAVTEDASTCDGKYANIIDLLSAINNAAIPEAASATNQALLSVLNASHVTTDAYSVRLAPLITAERFTTAVAEQADTNAEEAAAIAEKARDDTYNAGSSDDTGDFATEAQLEQLRVCISGTDADVLAYEADTTSVKATTNAANLAVPISTTSVELAETDTAAEVLPICLDQQLVALPSTASENANDGSAEQSNAPSSSSSRLALEFSEYCSDNHDVATMGGCEQ